MVQRNLNGWKPSIPDQRDFLYSVFHVLPLKLPVSASLKEYCSPIEDQGSLGSCTANSAAGALELLMSKNGVTFFDLSRLFVYYNSRKLEGTTNYDAGATLRDTVKSIAKWGACTEVIYPYIEAQFKKKPSEACYQDGKKRKISQYFSLKTLYEMKSCIVQGYPFIFGAGLYDSFWDVGENGIVKLPGKRENLIGHHAMCAVEYNDKTQMFTIRNSWGKDWGREGYCYIPYSYLSNPSLAADFWCIKV
jgi:C1A family cysteine protease